MKKIYFMLMLIMLILLTSSISSGHEINNKLMGKVIVLDAGHGGKDRGTSSRGIYESDINLNIVLKLRDELVKQGVNVILTRDGDYDLSSPNVDRRKKSDFDNRIKLINSSEADMYISIHMNYLADAKYYGAQTFYTGNNERLANVIQESLKKGLNSPMNSKKLSESIYMYKKLTIPGLLIECGFLSNSKERNLLVDDSYQLKIVKSIITGLIQYY